MADNEKVNKIIPSKLEKAVYGILYKTIGEHIPEWVTPNQVTAIGALSGLMGIVFAFLARFNLLFLIGTCIGITGHLVADDLDGFVARKRNMTSKAGAYFDLLTDILHITFLIIAMAFTGVMRFELAILMAPVYALIIFTSMNSILYLKEFPFPHLGPIETHMFFIAVCIVTMIWGTRQRVSVLGIGFNIADLIFIVGIIPMYFEMIRLQIKLFCDLSKKDKAERADKEAAEAAKEEA